MTVSFIGRENQPTHRQVTTNLSVTSHVVVHVSSAYRQGQKSNLLVNGDITCKSNDRTIV